MSRNSGKGRIDSVASCRKNRYNTSLPNTLNNDDEESDSEEYESLPDHTGFSIDIKSGFSLGQTTPSWRLSKRLLGGGKEYTHEEKTGILKRYFDKLITVPRKDMPCARKPKQKRVSEDYTDEREKLKPVKGRHLSADSGSIYPHDDPDSDEEDQDDFKHHVEHLGNLDTKEPLDIPTPPRLTETIYWARKITVESLKRDQKLVLLVDLDQTLIDTCLDPKAVFVKGAQQFRHDDVIKLRPYVSIFLELVSEKYELIVVTLGKKVYASQIIRILDPEQKYFKNRIFARQDMSTIENKEEVFQWLQPGVVDMVVAIDDSPNKWPSSFDGEFITDGGVLLPVKAYSVFHSSTQAFPDEYNVDYLIQSERTDIVFDMDNGDSFLKDVHEYLEEIHYYWYGHDGFNRTSGMDAAERTREAATGRIQELCAQQAVTVTHVAPPTKDYVIRSVGKLTSNHLSSQEKLILLCEIQNTFLDITEDATAKLIFPNDIHKCANLFVRIRPETSIFLGRLSKSFELVVVTKVSRSDAANAINVIDPNKEFFKNRIFAAEDYEGSNDKETTLKYFPRDVHDRIVVFDNRPTAWPNTRILLAEMYRIFVRAGQAYPPELIKALPPFTDTMCGYTLVDPFYFTYGRVGDRLGNMVEGYYGSHDVRGADAVRSLLEEYGNIRSTEPERLFR